MSYPSFEEYTDALRLPPSVVFEDPLLAHGSVRRNAVGVPFARSGNFALTYEVAVNGSRYAVRCFHKESDLLERRYQAISRKLKSIASPWFVEFDFQPTGIRTESGQFPIVRMQWADGCSLAQFISEHRDDPQTLLQLRETLRELARHLHEHDVAHGDIQPGNIIVRSATDLRLVDYDGMFVPELEPWGGTELGQRNFQHPGRSWLHYDERLDRFSFALLDVALEALAMQPALWELTGSDESSIVLRAADFLDPGASTAFGVLAELDGVGVRARQLAAVCRSPFERVPALDDFLAGRRIPAAGALTFTGGATATRPAYVPAYAVLNAGNFARCCAHIGDRIELIGQVRRVLRDDACEEGRTSLRVEFGDAREDMVCLSVWPESGLDSLVALEPGQWVSAIGLVDPILTETNGPQPYKSVSISISERSQLRLITQAEAQHRLAANDRPTRAEQDISVTIGTDPAIPAVIPRPSPPRPVSPITVDEAPTVVLAQLPAWIDPPGDLTAPITSFPVLEPVAAAPGPIEPTVVLPSPAILDAPGDLTAPTESIPVLEPVLTAPVKTRPIAPPPFATAPDVAASGDDAPAQVTAGPGPVVVAPVVTRPVAPREHTAAHFAHKPPVPPTAETVAPPPDSPPLTLVVAASVAAATVHIQRSASPDSVVPSASPRRAAPEAKHVRNTPRGIDWPLRWPAFRMPGMRWPTFSLPTMRWPAFRIPVLPRPTFRVAWPQLRAPSLRLPALRWPTVNWPTVRWPTLRGPALRSSSFQARRLMTEAAARWSSLRQSLPSPSQLRIDNPLPRLRAALQTIPVLSGLPARLHGAHPAWWVAAVLMAVVLVQSWIITRRPDGSAAIDGNQSAETDAAVMRPAERPRTESENERVAGYRTPAPDRGNLAAPPRTVATAAPAATTTGTLRSTQGPRLLAFEYLTSARRPITTIAGPIDIVTRAGPPRLSLIAVNGVSLDQSGAELNMLVHRSVFADREVIVGFSDCLSATPSCERKEPFWLLLRKSQPPVLKRSPGLRANRTAGAVTVVPSGVHVDLGLWDGVRQTATLTSLDDIYVTRLQEPLRPLSGADCRSVAAALESCAASRDCSSYETIVQAVPPARVATVQRLFHESTGLNEPMFRTVCVRSCELGLTPTSSLVRREVCSGAVRDQWAQAAPAGTPGPSRPTS